MNVREFLEKKNGISVSVDGRGTEYILYKQEARAWIKHKLKENKIPNEQYLKELLLVSKLEHDSYFLICNLENGNIYSYDDSMWCKKPYVVQKTY